MVTATGRGCDQGCAAWRREPDEDAHLEVLERLAIAAEMRDDTTGMHCYRVGKWSQLIARQLGIAPEEADAIEVAARLHDIGKIGIPDSILQKPGPLLAHEFAMVTRHTLVGAALLARGRTPQVRLAESVALTHHERWDGGGYPNGLRAREIPLAGRITAVADVFDALTHERSYKRAWPIPAARAEIMRLSGTHFDADVAGAFCAVLEAAGQTGGDTDAWILQLLRPARIMRMREIVLGNVLAA